MAQAQEKVKFGVEDKLQPNSSIKKAEFVVDVDFFMAQTENAGNVAGVLKYLKAQLQKYRDLFLALTFRRDKSKGLILEVNHTMEMILRLQQKFEAKEQMITQFLLSDEVYVKALVPPTDRVMLCMDTNVLMEYSLHDAQVVVTNRLHSAEEHLRAIMSQMEYLRKQYTTTECNIAHIYNWDITKRLAAVDKAAKEAIAAADAKAAEKNAKNAVAVANAAAMEMKKL